MTAFMTRQMERQFNRKRAAATRTRINGMVAILNKLNAEDLELVSAWLEKNPKTTLTRDMIPLIIKGAI